MQEMTSSSWRRRGSSFVWSPELLSPLIVEGEATPLRTVLGWLETGFPDAPPGDRQTILVGGLQTVLEAMLPDVELTYSWLRTHVLPLCRACGDRWERVGLVFGMVGPGRLFTYNEADDLVYFGRGTDRSKLVPLTRGIWNGAATGSGAYRLMPEDKKEVGGYHVQRVS
jgi:hypothetical protein